MTYTLDLDGPVPSKKNGKHSWGGRVVIDPEAKALMFGLQLQAQAKWNGRRPLERVKRISAVFCVRDGRGDADGKYTTLQDVLVKAGVLQNDSIARVPRFQVSTQIAEPEGVHVSLEVE